MCCSIEVFRLENSSRRPWRRKRWNDAWVYVGLRIAGGGGERIVVVHWQLRPEYVCSYRLNTSPQLISGGGGGSSKSWLQADELSCTILDHRRVHSPNAPNVQGCDQSTAAASTSLSAHRRAWPSSTLLSLKLLASLEYEPVDIPEESNEWAGCEIGYRMKCPKVKISTA